MSRSQARPFGSWQSPISSDLISSASIELGQIMLDGADVYWVEMRPSESGRNVVVRHSQDGTIRDLTPWPFDVRTTVHEYGGAAFTVCDGIIYFSNFSDQRIYRQQLDSVPSPLTPSGHLRYADCVLDSCRGRLICVREDHTGGKPEPVNALVAIDVNAGGAGTALVAGNDFYSSPCLSPDASRLAWLTWNHPNMPWDGTELWVSELASDGTLGQRHLVAGGTDESIFQPEWSRDGSLYFVSDRSGWWNIYRWSQGEVRPLCPTDAEFGRPQWAFGLTTYGFESADSIVCAYSRGGTWSLGRVNTENGYLQPLETEYTDIRELKVQPGYALMVAGSISDSLEVSRLNLRTRRVDTLRRSTQLTLNAGYVSKPRAIEFPTANGMTAHAFFCPPANADYSGMAGELPPLLVKSHGGPTGAASTALRLEIQYWTSRGIAVLDVNYRGSTGYGRHYRKSLDGFWGIVDVEDCLNGARYLVARGEVDGQRLLISGSSAGGYTTLCALTFADLFRAGASYYGIGDLEALVRDTHKFESRYLDRLVGPYPEFRDVYRERSPINFTDRLSCPIVFFQGLDDRVVPPSQAEAMVMALRAKGVPVAHVAFSGEQHGLRRSDSIKRAFDAELYFYSRVLGFTSADPVKPVQIDNL